MYAELDTRLTDLAADLAEAEVDDPSTLRRLGEISVRLSYLEVLCKRSISAGMHGGDSFGTASLAKTVWAEVGQDLAALAFDVFGQNSTRWADYRLTSRALSIAGGTSQVNKNVTARRVLGLPRP